MSMDSLAIHYDYIISIKDDDLGGFTIQDIAEYIEQTEEHLTVKEKYFKAYELWEKLDDYEILKLLGREGQLELM
ncbi:hypothetical protein [Francisella tularensis]|uniref:hypothetical protein n=1 Tax=Francisella tularensis TaxID=263 RepID=UPI0008F46F5F|nr:hypothetical protein [Francisella tularensis]APA83254.1 hypothetical protein N894_1270 [Francisella tularensis subsp. novicida PA10-7858]